RVVLPVSSAAANDLFEMSQGVTVGGKGCLELTILPRAETDRRALEAELVHSVAKGRSLTKWKATIGEEVVIYPYLVSGSSTVPAFSLSLTTISDPDVLRQVQ